MNRGGSKIFRTSVQIFLADGGVVGAGRGLVWTGRGRRQAWGGGGGGGALNNFCADRSDSPPLEF